MRIGLLQTGDAPEELHYTLGNYNDMFVRLLTGEPHDFEFSLYRILDHEFPDNIDECDGWLITGSRFSAYDTQAWIPALRTLIQQIVASKKPLIGICFGHQIIAEALGGKVEKSEKGWGLGLDTYQIDTELLADSDTQLTLNIFHQDQITRLPPGAKVYARSDFCEYAGMFIGKQVMTMQAHPEFEIEYNRQLLQIRKSMVIPENLADQAIAVLSDENTHTDSDRFGEQMAEFFITHHRAS